LRRLQGLVEDYYRRYGRRIAATTKDDVLRVAEQYVDLDHLALGPTAVLLPRLDVPAD
jgi:predicted Zn-dependent peptidase